MQASSDSTSRRDQIIASAERLFRERGYLATSVRDIGQAVGIRGASLYHHIGGKEDLLWASASRAAAAFFAALQPILGTPAPAPEKLRQAIVAHVGVITQNLEATAVYFRDWRYLNAERRAEFLRLRDEYEAGFRSILAQGVQEGCFIVPDEKIAVRFVLSAVNWTHQWYRPDGALAAEQVGHLLADLVLGGLTGAAGGPPPGLLESAVSSKE